MQSYERPGMAELRERLAVVESQIGTVTTDVNAVAEKVGELLDLVETVRRHSPSAGADQGTAASAVDAGDVSGEEGSDAEKNGDTGKGSEPTDNPYLPFSFYASDDVDERARKRGRLIDWVDDVLVPMYRITPAELPSCWPLHPFVVEQLEALRAEWTRIYYPTRTLYRRQGGTRSTGTSGTGPTCTTSSAERKQALGQYRRSSTSASSARNTRRRTPG